MKLFKLDFIIILFFISFNNLFIETNVNKNKIIVSLTSYPLRIQCAIIVIKSLLKQTIKPDKIILWLAKSDFPRKNKDLPPDLLSLKSNTVK